MITVLIYQRFKNAIRTPIQEVSSSFGAPFLNSERVVRNGFQLLF